MNKPQKRVIFEFKVKLGKRIKNTFESMGKYTFDKMVFFSNP